MRNRTKERMNIILYHFLYIMAKMGIKELRSHGSRDYVLLLSNSVVDKVTYCAFYD